MVCRSACLALLLALANASAALDAPSGVVGLPVAEKEQLPCGGAAVVISADGLALTLEEALPSADGKTLTVILPGGKRRQAVIVKRGTTTTAVLLRISDLPATVTPLTLADSASLHVGDAVWTAGNSFGALEEDGAAAISRGVISGHYIIPADSPPVRGRGGRILSTYRGDVLETDAAVNDGNQGGALLDDAGRLVALVSLGSARERRLGTAIPLHLVLRDLGLERAPESASAPANELGRALVRAAGAVAQGMALVYLERTGGLGNPQAVPRPPRLVSEVPAHERERTQRWWDAYYHQQQMFYTDQAVSALVLDAEGGLLLTAASNLHGDAERGEVLLPGGAIRCQLVARNLPLDLALLKAERALPLSAITLAPSPQLAVGQAVAVVGRHTGDGGFTVTSGVVSATTRRREQNDALFAQTDAHANYSSLGGAVIDAGGAVVGMPVLLGPDDDVQPWAINSGVALFVDSSTMLRALPLLKQGMSTRKAPIVGLGVQLRPAADGHLDIVHVTKGTGAEAAGLKVGDSIRQADGVDVTSHLVLSRILVRHRAGDHIDVLVVRAGEPLTVPVEIKAFGDEN